MSRDITAFRGPFTPDFGLIDQLTERFNLKTVFCLSVGSLKLEGRFRSKFKADGVEVLDLECAAFLAAVEKIGRCGAAVLTITDIVGEMPYSRVYQPEEKKKIAAAFSRAAGIVRELSGIDQ